MQQTFDLNTVMTFAVSAYKQKNNEYVNYGTVTNKTIIQTHLGLLDENRMVFVDHVTQECADIAEQMIQYYKGLTFKAFGAKINDFEQKVLGLINCKLVDRRDIGVIASLRTFHIMGRGCIQLNGMASVYLSTCHLHTRRRA